ncbi:MAG: lysostaphin resistance A-like protein [Promethearchaeota archaeon]
MILELIILLLPLYISAILEKKTIKAEFKEIGFFRGLKGTFTVVLRIILGVDIGIFLYFFARLFLFLYKDILIIYLFGTQFVEEGVSNSISTEPIHPNFLEITLIIILQVLITSPSEEGFFRGFLIQKFNRKLKLKYTVVISSTFFAFYHVPPFLVPLSTIITYFGYYFLLGFLLTLIFIYSNKSLLMCIISHSVFNILILVI